MKYFKTDGIRGKFPSNDFNIELLLSLGYSFSIFKERNVLIGYDTRYSSKIIFNILKYSIMLSNHNVIDCGVVSTPYLEYLSKKKKTIAVMITASHNDYTYNGIKIIKNGKKIANELKEKLELKMEEHNNVNKIGDYKEFKKNKQYYKYLNSIRTDNNLKIVFDLANGSLVFLNDYIKNRFKNSIILNNKPNGININDNCGSLYPECACDIMMKNNYDMSVSFDGDGDRCIIALKNGKILNGDLLLYYFANVYKKLGKLKNNIVICTEITNQGIIEELKKDNINVKTTNVGDENISALIENNISNLGGEKSGHIILTKRYNFADGFVTFLNFLHYYNNDIISKINIIKPYYEVNINKPSNINIKLLEENIKTILRHGKYIIRKSGTEDLTRITLMTKDKNEMINLISLIDTFNEIN